MMRDHEILHFRGSLKIMIPLVVLANNQYSCLLCQLRTVLDVQYVQQHLRHHWWLMRRANLSRNVVCRPRAKVTGYHYYVTVVAIAVC